MVNLQTDYLNLYDIFFNEIIGDVTLGIFIASLIFLINSIKFKIAYSPMVMLSVLFLVVLYIGTSIDWLWVLVGLSVSGLAYYKISKAINR